MSDFFRKIVSDMKDQDTTIMDDGHASAEFAGFVDTGCYIMNAVVSGSLYGGFADNKVLTIAGESSTGKTFLTLGIVKQFLDKYPDGGCIYFDTEAAVTRQMMIDRGIDPKRVIVSEPETLQAFRTKALGFLEKYAATPKKNRPKMMMVLDSLGALSSAKEIEDTQKGNDTRDMTKQMLIRGLFRVVRLKLAKLNVPMVLTNHTYAVIGAYVPTKEMSGGGGVKYASDSIIFLSKSKDKDKDTKITNGVFLKAMMHKSRLSRENQDVSMKLSYSRGLDRWYGLLDLGLETGLFTKTKSGQFTAYYGPDGEVVKERDIYKDQEAFFTQWLPDLEKAANKLFRYGEEEILAMGEEDPDLLEELTGAESTEFEDMFGLKGN